MSELNSFDSPEMHSSSISNASHGAIEMMDFLYNQSAALNLLSNQKPISNNKVTPNHNDSRNLARSTQERSQQLHHIQELEAIDQQFDEVLKFLAESIDEQRLLTNSDDTNHISPSLSPSSTSNSATSSSDVNHSTNNHDANLERRNSNEKSVSNDNSSERSTSSTASSCFNENDYQLAPKDYFASNPSQQHVQLDVTGNNLRMEQRKREENLTFRQNERLPYSFSMGLLKAEEKPNLVNYSHEVESNEAVSVFLYGKAFCLPNLILKIN